MTRAALALVALLAACDRRPPPPAPVADAAIAAVVDASPPEPVIDAGPATDECGPLQGKIKSAKSIGHTSIVYKIELEDGSKHAFKPNAKKMKDRWRGEVAAFRLGRALGLTNVPPACIRSYPTTELAALVGAPALEELIVAGDRIEGAVIPWITGLHFLPLEKEPLRSEARAWLRDRKKPIPADKLDLAAQISALVVFDAITTNWDRYSGANVGLDASGKRVLFIDNDAAFMTVPPERTRENQEALQQTERFSRSLLASLKLLTEEARLADAFRLGPDGSMLLPPAVIAAARRRIEGAVKIIEDKIAARSEADVLLFP